MKFNIHEIRDKERKIFYLERLAQIVQDVSSKEISIITKSKINNFINIHGESAIGTFEDVCNNIRNNSLFASTFINTKHKFNVNERVFLKHFSNYFDVKDFELDGKTIIEDGEICRNTYGTSMINVDFKFTYNNKLYYTYYIDMDGDDGLMQSMALMKLEDTFRNLTPNEFKSYEQILFILDGKLFTDKSDFLETNDKIKWIADKLKDDSNIHFVFSDNINNFFKQI